MIAIQYLAGNRVKSFSRKSLGKKPKQLFLSTCSGLFHKLLNLYLLSLRAWVLAAFTLWLPLPHFSSRLASLYFIVAAYVSSTFRCLVLSAPLLLSSYIFINSLSPQSVLFLLFFQ